MSPQMSGKQLATPSLEFRREVWPRDTHAGVVYVFKTMRLENPPFQVEVRVDGEEESSGV